MKKINYIMPLTDLAFIIILYAYKSDITNNYIESDAIAFNRTIDNPITITINDEINPNEIINLKIQYDYLGKKTMIKLFDFIKMNNKDVDIILTVRRNELFWNVYKIYDLLLKKGYNVNLSKPIEN